MQKCTTISIRRRRVCQSPGLWLSATMMGARNAALWFSGTAQQPAPLVFPIGDANCLKCHQDAVKQTDPNHFHIYLPQWQAVDANAATCVSCHGGHNTDGDATIALVNQTRMEQVCNACHSIMRQ